MGPGEWGGVIISQRERERELMDRQASRLGGCQTITALETDT